MSSVILSPKFKFTHPSDIFPRKRLLTKCAGTLGYMAPEVFGSKPYDGRSADLFSIGAVMHHMVVGVPPTWKADRNAYEFSGKMRYKQFSEALANSLRPIFIDGLCKFLYTVMIMDMYDLGISYHVI